MMYVVTRNACNISVMYKYSYPVAHVIAEYPITTYDITQCVFYRVTLGVPRACSISHSKCLHLISQKQAHIESLWYEWTSNLPSGR